jgi:hypothetical protein
MHYANGRAARAGDLVRGREYNIKYEIVGLIVFADPGASANNCQVATVTATSPVLHYAHPCPQPSAEPDSKGSLFYKGMYPPSFKGVEATLEYGQLDAFVAIDPATGEVLMPEGYEPPLPSASW